nr:methionyl-tRNA formyltransferase [Nakamurella flavida]
MEEFALRIVFAGTPQAAVPSLTALLASGHEVAAVLTRPDAPVGRGRTLQGSPVAEVAREAGLELLQPRTSRDPEFLRRLTEIAPQAGAIVAYGGLLPRPVLDVPVHGWVNLHFSLLPAWRGASPVQSAVRYGDDVTGASTFRLEEGLDTGPVFGAVTEAIGPHDTAGDLLERLSRSGAGLLVATLDGIADGSLQPVEQRLDTVTLTHKITVADAQVDWQVPALGVDRHIRALTPDPGAWTESSWGRLGLGPVRVTDSDTLPPGAIAAGKREVRVGTGTTDVVLGTVTAPGRRPMAAADWARGTRPGADDRFGPQADEQVLPLLGPAAVRDDGSGAGAQALPAGVSER